MSKIITNNITPRSGSSVGLTGDLTASGNITGVGGTFSGPVSGTTGTFSGNVSVGGTLTYEDVTNIDSVGVITARSGIVVTGIVTATSFKGDGSALTGVESWNQFDTWLYGGG
nr:phage tail fiber-like protein [uncultured Mediterranean phage uvMED]